MSDALELLANGKTAYLDARQDAWHKKGQHTLNGKAFTAQEAMEQAYLAGWDVRKTPLQTAASVMVGGEEMHFTLDVPRQYASVRTNPVTKTPDVLGVVGEHYVPIQNEEHAELLNAIVDEGGAHFETAGSLDGGRQVFITMEVPAFMDFKGKDAHKLYLAALNSHDGNSAYRFIITPVRIVCKNTQQAALQTAVGTFSVRHTRNAKQVVAKARQALDLTFKYGEEFEKEMTKLMEAPFKTAEMTKFANKLWTPPEKDASRTIVTRHEERLVLVKNLFLKSPSLKDFKGTRYAAYNAVTEYLDHFSPVPANAKDGQDVRATRTLTSAPVRATKEKAFELLKV